MLHVSITKHGEYLPKTVSRALIDDGLQRETEGDLNMKTKCTGNPITDAIFAEIKAERRAYIEEIGFDWWFAELLERNSVPEPDLEASLDKIFAELEEEERQKKHKRPA